MSKLYYLGRKVLVPADVWPDEPLREGQSGWEGIITGQKSKYEYYVRFQGDKNCYFFKTDLLNSWLMQEEKGIVDASGSSQENIKTVSKEESTKTPKPSKMENKKNIHRGVKRGRDIRGRAKRSAKSKSKHRNAHGAPIADSPDGNLGVGTPEDQEVAEENAVAEPEIREMADVHSPLLHQQKSLLERLKNQGDDMDEEETRSSLIAAINCILPRLTTDTLETIYFTTDEHLKKQTLLDSSERLVIFT